MDWIVNAVWRYYEDGDDTAYNLLKSALICEERYLFREPEAVTSLA